MICLETKSVNPYYNLAFEEYVLLNKMKDDYLILWQNDNTIVVGQNQNTEEEINRRYVEVNGISVVRRSTGGGAVYHDLGNLNYSFITDAGNTEEITITRFTRPVTEALCALGLHAEESGRNDILVDGKKVSGTAQRLSKGRILHHGTLLFDSDLEVVAKALRADPGKFQSKSTKSVRSRVGNIRESLKNIGKDMDCSQMKRYLLEYFTSGTDVQAYPLSEAELRQIEILKSEKYDRWEWNFGKSPKYNFCSKKRFSGGTVDVRISVEKGIIREIKFYGDFLSVKPLDKLEGMLCGRRFCREEIEKVMDQFNLQDFFGGIKKKDILELMR